jgi:hypothetical protein
MIYRTLNYLFSLIKDSLLPTAEDQQCAAQLRIQATYFA